MMAGRTPLLPMLLLLAAAGLVPAVHAAPANGADGAAGADGIADDLLGSQASHPALVPEAPAAAPPLAQPLPDVPVSAEVSVDAGGLAAVQAGTGSGIAVAVQGGGAAIDPDAAAGDGPLGTRMLGAVEPYAAPVAGTAIAVAAGALAWWALAALFPSSVPAFSLFSRIERSRVLDNPVRARVHEVVAQDPGLSLSDVAARAGIAWGTAVHHLQRLESNGLLVSAPGQPRRFFVANTPAAAQRKAVCAVLHPTARRIADLVAQRPGIDQSGICRALRLKNPAASKHLGQFEAQGLVLSQRSGRSRLYHATGGLHSALVLLDAPAEAQASMAVGATPGSPRPIAASC